MLSVGRDNNALLVVELQTKYRPVSHRWESSIGTWHVPMTLVAAGSWSQDLS